MIVRRTTVLRTHARRGQAVLDAALVFPVLMLLTFGCIEFGHYFFIKHTLQGAAREGARAAATGAALTDVTSAVAQCMSGAGFPTSKYTTTAYTVSGADPTNPVLTPITTGSFPTLVAGTPVMVKVSCVWGQVGIRPMQLLDATRVIYGTTTMRREG